MPINLRDIVKPRQSLIGSKVKIETILNRPLTFTDWAFAPSRQALGTMYLILQFTEENGEQHVVMTGSVCLMQDLQMFEAAKGHVPFNAMIVRNGKAFVFK